eukprot:GILI01005276.1.p2 GENE.GILI01005276.1~~GILI01005276.1.p2  ORF type:complete len:152 (+),score=38.86 GILI01005276.1:77-532(+)
MRHGFAFRKLSRDSAHRWAMLRNMVTSLIKHERIETTVPKAKELRRLADQVVTMAKDNTKNSYIKASGIVREKPALEKLFSELAERYKDREGGYTRVIQTRNRRGDWAPMAFIEYIDREGELREPNRPWAKKEDAPASSTPATSTSSSPSQ